MTRVAWLNRSNILYAGNDRWTSDPRVQLLINTPEEFSILITQVGLGDEGLYTCSFQTRHQPYTTQVYLIVHGEPSAGLWVAAGRRAPGRGGGFLESSPVVRSLVLGIHRVEGTHPPPSQISAKQKQGQSPRRGPPNMTASRARELQG